VEDVCASVLPRCRDVVASHTSLLGGCIHFEDAIIKRRSTVLDSVDDLLRMVK